MRKTGAGYPFALFAREILAELENRERFIDVMTEFYSAVAGAHDCYITVSERRFADAHSYWLDDRERMHMSQAGTAAMDHFNHGALIAFWLRRMVPINDVNLCTGSARVRNGRRINPKTVSEHQADFFRYGSERCALFAGFYICLSYEVEKAEADRADAGNVRHLGAVSAPHAELPEHFTEEYPRLMKSKNISPHGLYMTYRALFADTHWRVTNASAA